MSAAEVTALVSLALSPIAALSGVWLTSHLAAQRVARDRNEQARGEAMAALGRFTAVAVDANPALIRANDLREFSTPDEAVAGLYERWGHVREPLMVLSISHPEADVRRLAFDVQAELELCLRQTSDAMSSDEHTTAAEASYRAMLGHLQELAQLLSPFS